MANVKVPGTENPAPTMVDSATAVAIKNFAEAIPPQVDDNVVMFGRAPEETRVDAGMLREQGPALLAAARAYVSDIKRTLYDEYVVKHAYGRSITIGDLRDYVLQNAAPAPEANGK
jgi:hypothetical protein